MFYQKLLTGQNPYHVGLGSADYFPPHRHPEIELSFCLKGSYSIIIENDEYTLQAGDLALIKTTASHEYLENAARGTERITIEIGPGFLGEYFTTFAAREFSALYHLKDSPNPAYQELYDLFTDTAKLYESYEDYSALRLKGNLYQISALILEHLPLHNEELALPKKLLDIAQIEKAIEIIHRNYAEPLNIDTVSSKCGYSKSNFCKTFKNITGDTFHNLLNKHRIEIARLHLKEDDLSIEGVADAVGFADAKSFCRVFKKVTGISPGNYRKLKKSAE